LAVGAAGAILAVTHSSAARAQSGPLDTTQAIAALSAFNIQATPVPSSTPVAISEQQAEDTALNHFGQGTAPIGVTASLVRATDTEYANAAADGTRTPLIPNRTAWLVLIPDRQVPIFAPAGKSDESTYTATMAVLIDANSGDYLEAAALNS
jgi:hypothetical protein